MYAPSSSSSISTSPSAVDIHLHIRKSTIYYAAITLCLFTLSLYIYTYQYSTPLSLASPSSSPFSLSDYTPSSAMYLPPYPPPMLMETHSFLTPSSAAASSHHSTYQPSTIDITSCSPIFFDRWLSIDDCQVRIRRRNHSSLVPHWTLCKMRDFVNVAVVDAAHTWYVLRQNKVGIVQLMEGESMAPVGGYIEGDESPLQTAQRELLEELGYVTNDWYYMSTTVTEANRACNRGHLFLAKNVVKADDEQSHSSDDLEGQQLLSLSTSQLELAVFQGAFRVQSWLSTMALALLTVQKHEQLQTQRHHDKK